MNDEVILIGGKKYIMGIDLAKPNSRDLSGWVIVKNGKEILASGVFERGLNKNQLES